MAERASQAIVVIHGMGEHKPMSTLRGFAAGALPPDVEVYSQPDPVSGSYELRRLRVRSSADRPATFLYEYYWTHELRGNAWAQLAPLIKKFLLRVPWRLNGSLRFLWLLVWGILAAVGAAALYTWTDEGIANKTPAGLVQHLLERLDWPHRLETALAWVVPLLVALVVTMAGKLLLDYFGDVARYLDPHPDNVASRQRIRQGAVDLLRRLHEQGVDRIVVLGHSLGTYVAYDALRFLWAECYYAHDPDSGDPQTALAQLERLAAGLGQAPSPEQVAAFRAAQRDLWCERAEAGSPWRVSDLVTFASPLTHAAMLLARDADELARFQELGELPRCPPRPQRDGRYSYDPAPRQEPPEGRHEVRRLDSAALFACTRWTNVWFPSVFGVFGDWFGGPLRDVFGPGIRDRPIEAGRGRLQPGAAHVRYFTVYPEHGEPPAEGTNIAVLRDSLDLDARAWLAGLPESRWPEGLPSH